MSRIIALSLVTLLCCWLGACGPGATSAPNAPAAETDLSAPADVRLNDGQKWVVGPETTAGIRNMRKLVDSFASPEDPEAYQALRSALEIELAFLLKQLTAPDAAYEQLRYFLAPLREDFEGLSASAMSEQKQSLARIAEQLKRYDTFFSS